MFEFDKATGSDPDGPNGGIVKTRQAEVLPLAGTASNMASVDEYRIILSAQAYGLHALVGREDIELRCLAIFETDKGLAFQLG